MMPGPIDEQYRYVAAEAVAARLGEYAADAEAEEEPTRAADLRWLADAIRGDIPYPEGGWREHLARLERRVLAIERWIEGDPDADSETEP